MVTTFNFKLLNPMKRKNSVLIVFFCAAIFTALFYKNGIGLNLFLFESILILWLLLSNQFNIRNLNEIFYGCGLIITSFFTVLTFSAFAFVVNFIALFVFIGVVIYPQSKSILSTIGLSFGNLFSSQVRFINELSSVKIKGMGLGRLFRYVKIIIIPLAIILIFIGIYRNSNPQFDTLLLNVTDFLARKLDFILKDFDIFLILTFLLGLLLSNFFLLRSVNQSIISYDLNASNELIRKKNKSPRLFAGGSLLNEYRAGVFLLVALNAILLVFNIIDIESVWINFKWEGQFLKEFVHEGTYLLIISIIVSIFIVLYFFRNNINFYSRNWLLKYLSYFWLLQNGVLTISVAIRNVYYINYYSLAYRRIGLAIFLLLTLYGLFSVYIKVKRRKSAFYLLKMNALALYIALVLGSAINWDSFIAKYNFSHSGKSYLHLDYLVTLSDKSLPYLDIHLSDLKRIDSIQREKFPFIKNPMSPEEYVHKIENRKNVFLKKWESKKMLSWNLPEYLAYKKLSEQKKHQ